jgi:UDP-N-acetylglucosamine 2-epimerase (hydrolysing)
MGRQAKDLFHALQRSGKYFVVIKPNNDPGSEGILSVINTLPETQFKVIPSMRFGRFSELLRNAACILGNSSSGVREAPFLGIPSLDVGSRQTDRAFSVSISKLAAEDTNGILDFIATNWDKYYERQTEFGDGNATQKFIDLLKSDTFWQRSMQKKFHDVSS